MKTWREKIHIPLQKLRRYRQTKKMMEKVDEKKSGGGGGGGSQ